MNEYDDDYELSDDFDSTDLQALSSHGADSDDFEVDYYNFE